MVEVRARGCSSVDAGDTTAGAVAEGGEEREREEEEEDADAADAEANAGVGVDAVIRS